MKTQKEKMNLKKFERIIRGNADVEEVTKAFNLGIQQSKNKREEVQYYLKLMEVRPVLHADICHKFQF